MKEVVIVISAVFSIFFQACNSQMKDSDKIEIVGIWKSSDGAILTLNRAY